MEDIQEIGAATSEWIVHPEMCPALESHGLHMCGWSRAKPGFHFERPSWSMAQVLVSVDGHGEWMQDGQWIAAELGQALVCPLGAPHHYRCSDPSGWRVAWIHFTPEVSRRVVTSADAWVASCDRRQLQSAIEGCYREAMGAADPAVLTGWCGLIKALGERISRDGHDRSRLAHVWSAVDAAPAHAWNLRELAELAGIGVEQLRRLTRRSWDRAPMEQVAWLRMRRAEALLKTGYTIAATAEQVGYADAFAFSAAFKRVVGVPPSKVRLVG
ncbi:MAG: AraC family transcriptional regulator [Planctomycetota bacterium]|jgi:AraC family transcriptional regulator of arabinose operon|nr:AraC family transcriptional regulator [Planctomycetota bacterium]